MSPAGLQKYREAQGAHEINGEKSSANGVILHRKDELVVDGKYKWIPCVWKLEGSILTLTPCSGSEEVDTFHISSTTQYKKPKSKHYPLQFGTHAVFTSALLETVVHEATGYAPSPLDPLSTAGMQAIQGMCKIAALEQDDLEKVLLCIQAVIEGKHPTTHLK
mmetsp:Transcript_27261/g.31110  ORF Transcript_27261/g.31110 Transcript_27261/m.31110 type:complete len:163 (-) Transcript_27261:145-633(-)